MLDAGREIVSIAYPYPGSFSAHLRWEAPAWVIAGLGATCLLAATTFLVARRKGDHEAPGKATRARRQS